MALRLDEEVAVVLGEYALTKQWTASTSCAWPAPPGCPPRPCGVWSGRCSRCRGPGSSCPASCWVHVSSRQRMKRPPARDENPVTPRAAKELRLGGDSEAVSVVREPHAPKPATVHDREALGGPSSTPPTTERVAGAALLPRALTGGRHASTPYQDVEVRCGAQKLVAWRGILRRLFGSLSGSRSGSGNGIRPRCAAADFTIIVEASAVTAHPKRPP
jgi:hypothetical protein